MSIRVFGLTGGIGSGKSAVGACFVANGIPIIDADQLARDVVVPGSDGLAEIVRAFGSEVLNADGTLDRGAIGKRVFASPEDLRTLNGITHPRINQKMLERAQHLSGLGYELACYEAALIIENRAADLLRPLVVVVAPMEDRIARIVARDKATQQDARRRIDAQIGDADRRKHADIVIENDSTLGVLESRAREAIGKILIFLNIRTLPASCEAPSERGSSA